MNSCSAPRFVPQHGYHGLPWYCIGLLVLCACGTALRSCARCGARRLNRWSLPALRPAKFSIPSAPSSIASRSVACCKTGRALHTNLLVHRHARRVEAPVCVLARGCVAGPSSTTPMQTLGRGRPPLSGLLHSRRRRPRWTQQIQRRASQQRRARRSGDPETSRPTIPLLHEKQQ